MQNRINQLLKYREKLTDEEKEVFDMLIKYAREIAYST